MTDVDWGVALASINRPAELKKALPISYVLERHGVAIVSGEGRLHAVCPFHSDHDPSFDVYPWKGGARWGCWVCGVGGDVFDLLRRIDPSLSWGTAVERAEGFLAEMLASDWQEPVMTPARDWDAIAAGRLLESARLSPVDAVGSLIARKGWPFSAQWLIATWGVGGMGQETLIPYFSDKLELVGLKHRSAASPPISAPGSRLSGVLYGEWKGFRPRLPVLLCESESDCWVSSFRVGDRYDVLGLSTGAGSNPKAAVKLAGRRVLVAFDGDFAGRTATDRWVPDLQAQGCEVSRVDLPDGWDMAALPNHDFLRMVN